MEGKMALTVIAIVIICACGILARILGGGYIVVVLSGVLGGFLFSQLIKVIVGGGKISVNFVGVIVWLILAAIICWIFKKL
jgi:hypothetical protein